MTTNRSERIEEAANEAVVRFDAYTQGNVVSGLLGEACRAMTNLRAALASREEEPPKCVDCASNNALGDMRGTDGKPRCGPCAWAKSVETIADTFPRAPKDAEEREATSWPSPTCFAANGDVNCSRSKHTDGDHIAACAGKIVARWPQPAPAKVDDDLAPVTVKFTWSTRWAPGVPSPLYKAVADDGCCTDSYECYGDAHLAATRALTQLLEGRASDRRILAPAPLPAAASEGEVVVGWRVR